MPTGFCTADRGMIIPGDRTKRKKPELSISENHVRLAFGTVARVVI
jgi:hypothetical protein